MDEERIDAIDKNVFWFFNYVWPFFWIVLFIANVLSFSFSWTLLVLLGLSLSFANLVGFYKCSKDQQKKVKAQLQQAALNNLVLNRL